MSFEIVAKDVPVLHVNEFGQGYFLIVLSQNYVAFRWHFFKSSLFYDNKEFLNIHQHLLFTHIRYYECVYNEYADFFNSHRNPKIQILLS